MSNLREQLLKTLEATIQAIEIRDAKELEEYRIQYLSQEPKGNL